MLRKTVQALASAWFIVFLAAVISALAFQSPQSKGEPAVIEASKIFMHECKDCHGEDGRGRMLNQPDFTNRDWQKSVTDERMFKTIKFGREPMPFYAGALTDEQINALVKYIRSFAKDEQPNSQSASARGNNSTANNCALCHQKLDDQAVALYSKSTHANFGLNCEACHGGDPNATDKATAHAVKFTGKPNASETLAMCGSCHAAQLATFKTSLHFPEPSAMPRVACVECHGAHTIGSVSRNFSFALYCTGCHGLEYLRDLPREFHQMLSLADEEKDLLAKLESSGRKPSDELLARRKQLRRSVAEIVHATDTSGGLKKIPQILKLGDEFKAMIERETR